MPRQAEERVKTVRESEIAKRQQGHRGAAGREAGRRGTRSPPSAEQVRAAVEAEAQRLLNEAENVLTDPARDSLFRRKLLEHVEGIVPR